MENVKPSKQLFASTANKLLVWTAEETQKSASFVRLGMSSALTENALTAIQKALLSVRFVL